MENLSAPEDQPGMTHDAEPAMTHDAEPAMTHDAEPEMTHDAEPAMTHDAEPEMTHDGKPAMTHDAEPEMTHDAKPAMTHDTKPGMTHDAKPGMTHDAEAGLVADPRGSTGPGDQRRSGRLAVAGTLPCALLRSSNPPGLARGGQGTARCELDSDRHALSRACRLSYAAPVPERFPGEALPRQSSPRRRE